LNAEFDEVYNIAKEKIQTGFDEERKARESLACA
jgi:hypothetical protein